MKLSETPGCDECNQVKLAVQVGDKYEIGTLQLCMDCLQQALRLIEPLHDDDVIVCPACNGAKQIRNDFSDRPYACCNCMTTGQMTRKEARELRLVPSLIED